MLKFEKAGEYEDVIYERSGYVARITLNSPETLNTGVKDFNKALAVVEEAEDIKVLIIKGAGRALAAGAPLNEVGFVYGWKEPKSGEKSARTPIRNRLKFDRRAFFEGAQKLMHFPKITIVQAHGFLLGASMDMYLACDFLVGADSDGFLAAATSVLDGLENSTDGVLHSAVTSFEDQIDWQTERIDREQERVDQVEEGLRAQMAAADALIAALEQQANYFNSLFASMLDTRVTGR